MKIKNRILFGSLIVMMTILTSITISVKGQDNDQSDEKTKKTPLMVQVSATQGDAAEGNSEPANFLVVVTEARTGVRVRDLTKSDFQIISHFSSQKNCGLSKELSGFVYAGKGAYRI